MHFRESDIVQGLEKWPRLRRRPSRVASIAVLEGEIFFELSPVGKPTVQDTYRVRLEIPIEPGAKFPLAQEVGGRIPQGLDSHNPEGRLCLGSPLRLLTLLGQAPSLNTFIEQCVVPFLYAHTLREQGYDYPFSELAHGTAGLVDDYVQLFGLKGGHQVPSALHALSLRKRVANKRPCPCQCGKRLGRCQTRQYLAPFRHLAPRWLYRAEHMGRNWGSKLT
jgi:hypothetical protein